MTPTNKVKERSQSHKDRCIAASCYYSYEFLNKAASSYDPT